MIRFEQVTRRYEADGRPALDDVTVEFYRGDFAFLIGASGSGKSTLLRMILREGLPQRGKVTVAGQNLGLMLDRRVPDFRRSMGMVFQDFRLLPDKTVFDNVAFAMRVLGAKRSAIRKRVTKVLEKVDLAHLAKRYPHEISGGEQQRAAIARAIVNDPAILLADEPTGNLDPRASAEVMKVLRWINASGTTVIMATHDRAIVDQANSRVVQLHHGRVVRDEPHGFYDPPEGSEAWDVLAQEESESGLRVHDPAPLKTGIAPVLVDSDPDGVEDDIADSGPQEDRAQHVHAEEHHTWEPDTQDHHFVESRDESIDHVGDHPEDQVMAPGEDPSVLAYEKDPVLQETARVDFTEELTEMDLEDEAADREGTRDAEMYEDVDSAARWDDDSVQPVLDEPFNEELIHAEPVEAHPHEPEPEPEHDVEDSEREEETALRVTWPDHLRNDAHGHGHDVPEPHGDFNGTEMPDLEQDGYTETDDESEYEAQSELRADHEDDFGLQSAEPPPEESVMGEIPAASEPAVATSQEPHQPQPPSGPMLAGDPPTPLAPAITPPARPRLSWLAHADDDDPQRPTPQTFTPEPPDPGLAPAVEPEPEPEPEFETEFETELVPEPYPAFDPEPELQSEPEVRRPVPKPKSSTAQSTDTDARGTSEHLRSSRSRRSILRRLRRNG